MAEMTSVQREWLIREFGRRLQLPYPMGLLEMLEESLELYRRYFPLLFGLALVPALLSVFLAFFPTLLQTTPGLYTALFIVGFVVSYLLTAIVAFIGYGAQIWAAGKIVLGQPVGFGEAWVAVLRRAVALFFTLFLAIFPTMAGVLLCGIGVLVTTTLFFAVLEQVVLLEGVAYFRAIARHVRLVWNDWLKVLGFLLVAYLVIVVAQLLLGWGGAMGLMSVEIAREALPLPTYLSLVFISNLWNQLANALVMPYWSVFLTLLYFDLRARREAHDLQVLLQRWETLGAAKS